MVNKFNCFVLGAALVSCLATSGCQSLSTAWSASQQDISPHRRTSQPKSANRQTSHSQPSPGLSEVPQSHKPPESASAIKAVSYQIPTPSPSDEPTETAEAEQEDVSLATFETWAEQHNPALSEAAARVSALQGKWVQVGLYPNPILGYSGQQLGSNGQAEQNGILVEQEFVRGGKLDWNRQVACHEINVARQQWAAQRMRVLTDVRLAYYETVIAQRRVHFAQQLLEVQEKAVKSAEALFKAKETHQVAVLQSRISRDESHILLQNEVNKLRAAWQRLVTVSGRLDLPQQPLTDSLTRLPSALDWEAAWEQVSGNSPQLAAAALNIERARAAYQRAQVEPIPNVTVQAMIQHDNSTQGQNGVLVVGLPIPTWNRNQGGIQQARAEIVEAEQALNRSTQGLQAQLATRFAQYANAQFQISQYSAEILPNSQRYLQLTLSGYEAEELPYLDVLASQQAYLQTNLAYLAALSDFWTSHLLIEGCLLSQSLESSP